MKGRAHIISDFQNKCAAMVAPRGMRLAGPGTLSKMRKRDKTLKVRCTKPRREKGK
jgi:hypothetical protein